MQLVNGDSTQHAAGGNAQSGFVQPDPSLLLSATQVAMSNWSSSSVAPASVATVALHPSFGSQPHTTARHPQVNACLSARAHRVFACSLGEPSRGPGAVEVVHGSARVGVITVDHS